MRTGERDRGGGWRSGETDAHTVWSSTPESLVREHPPPFFNLLPALSFFFIFHTLPTDLGYLRERVLLLTSFISRVIQLVPYQFSYKVLSTIPSHSSVYWWAWKVRDSLKYFGISILEIAEISQDECDGEKITISQTLTRKMICGN